MLPAYPKQNRLSLSPLGRHQVSVNTHTKLPSQARLKKQQHFSNGPGDKAKSHAYSTTVLHQVSANVTGVWILRYITVGFYYKAQIWYGRISLCKLLNCYATTVNQGSLVPSSPLRFYFPLGRGESLGMRLEPRPRLPYDTLVEMSWELQYFV